MRGIRPSHKHHVGILPDDVSRVRSYINLVSRVVHLLTQTDDARAYIVPYLHRRFIPTTVGAHRGAKCAWIHNSMGPIFINDDGEFITVLVKQFGRIKIFIHMVAAGLNINIALVCCRSTSPNQDSSASFCTAAGSKIHRRPEKCTEACDNTVLWHVRVP